MMFSTLEDLIDAIGRRDELPAVNRAELDEILNRALLDWNDRRRHDSLIRGLRDLTMELKKQGRPRRGK